MSAPPSNVGNGKFCPACGTPVAPLAQFCLQCGGQLNHSHDSAAIAQVNTAAAENRLLHRLPFVAIAAALLLSVVVAVFFAISHS